MAYFYEVEVYHVTSEVKATIASSSTLYLCVPLQQYFIKRANIYKRVLSRTCTKPTRRRYRGGWGFLRKFL